jgi:hypothetical protein
VTVLVLDLLQARCDHGSWHTFQPGHGDDLAMSLNAPDFLVDGAAYYVPLVEEHIDQGVGLHVGNCAQKSIMLWIIVTATRYSPATFGLAIVHVMLMQENIT